MVLQLKQDWLLSVYSGRLEYICWNLFYPAPCIDSLFGVRILFRSLVQRLIQVRVCQSRDQSMIIQVTDARGKLISETYLYLSYCDLWNCWDFEHQRHWYRLLYWNMAKKNSVPDEPILWVLLVNIYWDGTVNKEFLCLPSSSRTAKWRLWSALDPCTSKASPTGVL